MDEPQRITIPIAVGVIALLIGIGGTIFYFGGSLRQVDVNTTSIARLAEDINKLPAADSNFREIQATLRARVDALQNEIDSIKRDFRPREYWEHASSDVSVLRSQAEDLMRIRDSGIREWTILLQRVSSLEAHYTDLSVRSQQLSVDVRDELNFWRNSSSRRVDPAQQPPIIVAPAR